VIALGLGLGQRAVIEPGADPGQPCLQLPRQARGALRRLRRARQRPRELVAQRRRPGLGQAAVVAAGRREALAAHHLPDHPELRAGGPGLDRRPRPQQPGQLIVVGAGAAPLRPRQLIDKQRQPPRWSRAVPGVVPLEPRQPRIPARPTRDRTGSARTRTRTRTGGRRLGIAVRACALAVLLPWLSVHPGLRSMMIIKRFIHSNSIAICCVLPAVGAYLGDTLSLPSRLDLFDSSG
jgi:hypothetical protein